MKKWSVIALIAICIAIASYGTVAYFTYEETATNVITAGNVRIALRQWQMSETGAMEVYDGPLQILPGTSVSKVVAVENTGGNPAWVRISVEKVIELAVGVSGEVDLELIQCAINTEFWTEKDGYYYYNVALQPGATTEPLLTQVAFAENMGNQYQDSLAILNIVAQATQVVHNGETVWQAAGWPQT